MKKALSLVVLTLLVAGLLSFTAAADDSYTFSTLPNTCNENYQSVLGLSETSTIYTHEQLGEDIDALVAKYPGKVEKRVIGYTELGREIYCLVIGADDAPNKFLALGGSHAREYIGTNYLMKEAEFLLANWDNSVNGERLSDLFNRCQYHFVPMHNADGSMLVQQGISSLDVILDADKKAAKIAELTPLMQTMNAIVAGNNAEHDTDWTAPGAGEYDFTYWKGNARGVDSHYNFWNEDTRKFSLENWGYEGLSGFRYLEKPCYMAYIGTEPLSEPETKAVADYCEQEQFNIMISFHTLGNVYQWSHGYSYDTAFSPFSQSEMDLASSIASRFSAFMANTKEADNFYFVGFNGYIRANYRYAYTAGVELGQRDYFNGVGGMEDRVIDASPVAIEQFTTDYPNAATPRYSIWTKQKFTPVYMAQYLTGNGLVVPAGSANDADKIEIAPYGSSGEVDVVLLKSDKLDNAIFKLDGSEMIYNPQAGGYMRYVAAGAYTKDAAARAITREKGTPASVDFSSSFPLAQKTYYYYSNGVVTNNLLSDQATYMQYDPVVEDGFGITAADVNFYLSSAVGRAGFKSALSAPIAFSADPAKTGASRGERYLLTVSGGSGTRDDKYVVVRENIPFTVDEQALCYTLADAIELPSGAAATYYSDSGCTNSITSVALGEESRGAVFYARIIAGDGSRDFYQITFALASNQGAVTSVKGVSVTPAEGDGKTTATAYKIYTTLDRQQDVYLSDFGFPAGVLKAALYTSGVGEGAVFDSATPRTLVTGVNEFFLKAVAADGSLVWTRMFIDVARDLTGAEITGIKSDGMSSYSSVFSKGSESGYMDEPVNIVKENFSTTGEITFTLASSFAVSEGAAAEFYSDESFSQAITEAKLNASEQVTIVYAKVSSADKTVYYRIKLALSGQSGENSLVSAFGTAVTAGAGSGYSPETATNFGAVSTDSNTVSAADFVASDNATVEVYTTADFNETYKVSAANVGYVPGRAAGAQSVFYVKITAQRGDVRYGIITISRTLAATSAQSTELDRVGVTSGYAYGTQNGTAYNPITVSRGNLADRASRTLAQDFTTKNGSASVEFFTDVTFSEPLASNTQLGLSSTNTMVTVYFKVTAADGATCTYYVATLYHNTYTA